MKNKIQSIVDLEAISQMLADEVENSEADALFKSTTASSKEISKVRTTLLNTALKCRADNLLKARERYNAKKDLIAERTSKIPVSTTERRSLFEKLVAKMPSIDPNFALQFREHKKMSDEEISSILSQAELLGFLEKLND